jgi:hypothetical protein
LRERRKSCGTGRGVRKIRPKRREGERNRQQRGKSESQTSKEGKRHPSEKTACPSRRMPSAVRTKSGRRQTQRGGKGCWDAEHLDRDWPGCGTASIASQPLLPAETRPRALCTRQDHVREGWRSGGWWRQAHLQALVAHQPHAGTPMCSAAPIAPEERGRTHLERMQQHAHLARLSCRAAIPLTLLAQLAGTTAADAGAIHHAQAAIGFAALLMREQGLVSRTAQRPIGLEGKVLTGEAARFPGQTYLRGSIARGRSRVR